MAKWRTIECVDGAQPGAKPYKLGAFVDGAGWVEHRFGGIWHRETTKGVARLMVASDESMVDLILRLAGELEPPFRILYVLLVPREDRQDEGRFEMAGELDHHALESFLRQYQQFFEEDARHHLWVSAPDQDANIVYDQHNVLYLYGPLDRFERVLVARGLNQEAIQFPSPHSHHYHSEMDSMLDEMLERYEWRWYPLDTRTD